MKITHKLWRWHKFKKDAKFKKTLASNSVAIKKNGTIMYYTPGYGSSYISYFHNREDARTIRILRVPEWHKSGERIHKCQVYYTLEKI